MKPSTQIVLAMLEKAGKSGVCASTFLERGIGRFGARIFELRGDHDLVVSIKVCREHTHRHGPVYRYILEGRRVVKAEQLVLEVG